MKDITLCDACGRMLLSNRKNGTLFRHMGLSSELKSLSQEKNLCNYCLDSVLKYIEEIRVTNKERFDILDNLICPPEDH